jgi:hypothetical protein
MEHPKTKTLRFLIVTVGIIPGLWLCFGVDPEAQISNAFFSIINNLLTIIAPIQAHILILIGDFLYALLGFISAFLTWYGVYKVGGAWGLLAVGAAFVGAVIIDTQVGIWLIIVALLATPLLPVDEEHSLDKPY